MFALALLIVMLSDAGLEKRIRSAVVTVSLVAAFLNGDKLQVLSLLQIGT